MIMVASIVIFVKNKYISDKRKRCLKKQKFVVDPPKDVHHYPYLDTCDDASKKGPDSDKVTLYKEIYIYLYEVFQILETLLTLGKQIQSCTDGFDDIKNRLNYVETSFSKNLRDLQTEYEVKHVL